jgi:hypothetical protein
MYWNDYDGMLPSSYMHQPSSEKTWDVVASAEFCSELGVVPPPAQSTFQDTRYVQILWPHFRNKSIMWCPSDKTAGEKGSSRFHITPGPESIVSYIFKPAVDRAWFGVPDGDYPCPIRKEGDFEFVGDQVMFFERKGWHWGGQNRGWHDGITINVVYMDGRVSAVRLMNSADIKAPDTVAGFAESLLFPGEPMWYNYDMVNGVGGVEEWYDARKYCDIFP